MIQIAICGEFLDKPTEHNPICANAVRLYKYLIPDYCDEFAHSLRQFVVDNLVLKFDSIDAVRDDLMQRRESLLQLYGQDALPDDVMELYNDNVGDNKQTNKHTHKQTNKQASTQARKTASKRKLDSTSN